MTIRMPLTLNRFSLVFASILAIPIYYTWMYYYSSAKGQLRRENTVFNNTARPNQYESVVEPGLMQIVNMDEYGHSKLQSRARLNVRVDPRILSTEKTQQILWDSIELFHSNKFIKPPNEVCEKRPPSAIVIGVQKSGTRELIDFMHLHPHIQIYRKKEHYEMNYFSRRYNKSMGWFKKQMPCSFSNQITVMKNSGYFHMDTVDVPERIRKFNASIKLILIVREPIARSYSAYTFFKERRGYKESFGEIVINAIKNKKQELPKLLKMSIYDESMKRWLQVFNLSQILIIDHSEFKQDPVSVLVKVEEFLGLGHYITTDMFTYNAVTGFQCIWSNLTTTGMSCYASNRGRPQDPISREIKSNLTGYFKPANKRFFGIIGRPFNW